MTNQTPAANCKIIDTAGPQSPWLIMVHGVSQNHKVFNRQVDNFGRHFRLMLVDMPGHGLSSDIGGPYGLTEYANSIRQTLVNHGVQRCHCWGTHLGAGATLVLASMHPELFDSLVLESPIFPGRPLESVSHLLPRVAETASRDGIAQARDLWWREGGWFDVMRANPEQCRAAEQQALIAEFQGGPWLDSGLASKPIPAMEQGLKKLLFPVLIYNGEHDLPDFVAAADELESYIQYCERATIGEAGGFPLWEFPARVNQTVENFLLKQRN